jgi:hypothetical protein
VTDDPAISQEHRRVGPGMEWRPVVAAIQLKFLAFQNTPEKFQRFINDNPH